MSQKYLGKLAKCAVWFTLAAVLSIGCNPLATMGFLFGGDPVKSAECPLEFKDGPKKGKEVVVALFVTSGSGKVNRQVPITVGEGIGVVVERHLEARPIEPGSRTSYVSHPEDRLQPGHKP